MQWLKDDIDDIRDTWKHPYGRSAVEMWVVTGILAFALFIVGEYLEQGSMLYYLADKFSWISITCFFMLTIALYVFRSGRDKIKEMEQQKDEHSSRYGNTNAGVDGSPTTSSADVTQ